MLPVHVIIYRRPDEPVPTAAVRCGDNELQTLGVGASEPPHPFEVSFELLCARLNQLPGMFVEPDGSWVWRATDTGRRWQLDGQLTDDGTRMLHLEVTGECPLERWDQLLACLDWPQVRLMYLLVKEGVYVEEFEFRRLMFPAPHN